MKIRSSLMAIAMSFLLASNAAMAGNDKNKGKDKDKGNGPFPEISVSSGTSAIALLTGVLLLVGERSRTRRS